MGTGYTRNDTSNNIADGNVINASDLDGEFDAIQSAFNGSSGHSHDGTTGEGPQIATAGIADGNITTVKLADDAVTPAKLQDSGTFQVGQMNAGGDGSSAGTTIKDAKIEVRSGSSAVPAIDLYCEVSNAHKVTIKSPPHASYSGDVTFQLPASNGTNGQFLQTNGSGVLSYATVNTDLSNDTSPQLGGVLDTNGNNIEFGDSTGAEVERLKFGAGDDLSIYHDGSNSIIEDAGTGGLRLQTNSLRVLKADASENIIQGTADGSVILYHDNSAKLTTTSTGVNVTSNNPNIRFDDSDTSNNGEITLDNTSLRIEVDEDDAVAGSVLAFRVDGTERARITSNGIEFNDNNKAIFGTGDDFEMFHNGTNTILENKTGDFLLRTQGTGALKIQDTGGNNMAVFIDNGACQLMHNASTKLATASGGVDVTGTMYASGNIGLDSTDYIAWSNNSHLDFVVNGAIDMRLESDGDLHVEGDVIGFSTTIASDPRLKENVEPVTDALSKVEQLTGYTFDYKDGGASAGVMSTDVAQVLPSAVSQKALPLKTGDEETEYDVVAYDQLHALLIEAVKELSARVKELENGSNG